MKTCIYNMLAIVAWIFVLVCGVMAALLGDGPICKAAFAVGAVWFLCTCAAFGMAADAAARERRDAERMLERERGDFL